MAGWWMGEGGWTGRQSEVEEVIGVLVELDRKR
jgi:hypothetical protein